MDLKLASVKVEQMVPRWALKTAPRSAQHLALNSAQNLALAMAQWMARRWLAERSACPVLVTALPMALCSA